MKADLRRCLPVRLSRPGIAPLIPLIAWAAVSVTDLQKARDQQNLAVLDGMIAQLKSAAEANSRSGEAQYRLALAYSYAAEVAMELHDKKRSEAYAEAGMAPARKAVDENCGGTRFWIEELTK
jgi:hypothetical protein